MEKLIEAFNNKYSVSSDGVVYSLKGKKKNIITADMHEPSIETGA